MGGGLRQAGVITASARVAVEETFLGGRLAATHERAKEVAKMWEERGGRVQEAVETNMVWLDLEDKGIPAEELVKSGVEEGLKFLGGRIVVHYQICEEAVERLGRVMDAVLKGKGKGKGKVANGVEREAEKVMEPEME